MSQILACLCVRHRVIECRAVKFFMGILAVNSLVGNGLDYEIALLELK
jgi:hypothetical protein